MLEEKIKASIREVPNFPKPGINFKDITPLLQDFQLCDEIVSYMAEKLSEVPSDAIVGIESRGFLFGMLLAKSMGLPFVPVRKKGKLPYKTISHKYDLEYGSAEVEMHEDAIEKGARVIIHDDLLATGGTAVAAAKLVEKLGGSVTGFAFLVNLSFLNGEEKLKPFTSNIVNLVNY